MAAPVELDHRLQDTFLAADATAAATTLQFGHDSGLATVVYPGTPFLAILDPDDPSAREVVRVHPLAGAVATVARGVAGTTAQPHKVGARVRWLPNTPYVHVLTFGTTDVNGFVTIAHLAGFNPRVVQLVKVDTALGAGNWAHGYSDTYTASNFRGRFTGNNGAALATTSVFGAMILWP